MANERFRLHFDILTDSLFLLDMQPLGGYSAHYSRKVIWLNWEFCRLVPIRSIRTAMTRFHGFLALSLTLFMSLPVLAHDGRRFEVQVIENQLWARGYVGGPDDGGGNIRPYFNSLHDHWTNAPGDKQEALANLPAWDVHDTDPLLNHQVSLTLVNSFKWQSPPLMPAPGTVPQLDPLAFDDVVTIQYEGQTIDTNNPGTIILIDNVDPHGHFDLHLDYQIEKKPADEIYVLEWVLDTTAPDVAASRSIFTLLSPDGATPEERLHHASLYTEAWLGVAIPEPGTAGLLALLAGLAGLTRQRRRAI